MALQLAFVPNEPPLYRYQKEIPALERRPIARQLNTLLRQGKIPKQLKDQTFELLASDQEKKQFLKDFKHYNELWQFLEKKNKLDEAVDELIDASKLDLLLKNSFEADEKWQLTRRGRLAEIYNCINANEILSAVSGSSDKDLNMVLQSSSRSPYAAATWGQEWSNMLNVVGASLKSGTLPAKDVVESISPWSANFVTAIVKSPLSLSTYGIIVLYHVPISGDTLNRVLFI